jgi:hypothetical protein
MTAIKNIAIVPIFEVADTVPADQMEENNVGWAYGTHGRGEKRVQGFGGKARRKKTT